MPVECSRGYVEVELKSTVGEQRFKNIRLKVVNKGPAELMQEMCAD